MASTIYPKYPPELGKEQLDEILFALKDWSLSHGLAVRPSPAFVPAGTDPGSVLAVGAPVTLFPSPFPRKCFEEATEVQKAYNELYAAISQDENWLGKIVNQLIGVDDFIARLWDVHLKVSKEGYTQDLSLGLFRSDYMVHIEPNEPSAKPQIRQVEFNTISSSFGGLSTLVSQLHQYLDASGRYPPLDLHGQPQFIQSSATKSLAAGLHAAHIAYGPSKSQPSFPLCILFIVQSPERNIFDQRHLEYDLYSNGTPSFRLPFSQTLQHAQVREDASRTLIYTPPHSPSTTYEVSVIYFRATYTPDDFPSNESWEARHQLERSGAIKCPSILTHLAGSKKVQQVLATPTSPDLAHFLPDPKVADQVRKTFAAIYPLDSSSAGKQAISIATDAEKSQGYVLKPQREGGGNNIYRGAIPGFLQKLGNEEKWGGHILMEMIEPPAQQNSIFREGVLKSGEVVAELGIYGSVIWRSNGEILHNEEAGYLLRTKGRESEEGGVAAGFGSVDSVVLIDV